MSRYDHKLAYVHKKKKLEKYLTFIKVQIINLTMIFLDLVYDTDKPNFKFR